MSQTKGKMAAAMDEQPILDLSKDEDRTPWVAVQLFTPKQMKVADALKKEGMTVFIPMEWADVEDPDGHRHHVLRPVVRNLLFMKATTGEKAMRSLVASIPYPIRLVTASVENPAIAMIPARQMFEFQTMCNPDIMAKIYLSEQQAKLKKGTPVRVTRGPLAGLEGRLVRASKKYYLLKEVPGIAVMLKVTRWCCEPIG